MVMFYLIRPAELQENNRLHVPPPILKRPQIKNGVIRLKFAAVAPWWCLQGSSGPQCAGIWGAAFILVLHTDE